MTQASRLDDWISRHRPTPPNIGLGESLEVYERKRAAYREAVERYAAELQALRERHPEIAAVGIPDGVIVDGELSLKRTFEIRERKEQKNAG